MKKLLIASVSVLALSAGAAFAQSNGSGINQLGTNNSATVDQLLGTGSSNNSQVNQGYYSPDGGTPSLYSIANPSTNGVASVTQIGGNRSVIDSRIEQTGVGHHATVTQTGSAGGSQTSNISQSNSGNTEASNPGNTAIVRQTTASTTDNQQSDVTQSGYNGYVNVSQTGPSDTSFVTQGGTGNNPNWTSSNVSLSGLTAQVLGGVNVSQGGQSANTSAVYQYSDYSGVSVKQDGAAGGTNGSIVTQTAGGSHNAAAVEQHAIAGLINTSTITQTGSLNLAGVEQDSGNLGGLNISGLTQNGDSNTATVWQTSTGGTNLSTIGQTGNGNIASVHQH